MSNIDITKHKCECGSLWFEIVVCRKEGEIVVGQDIELTCVACEKKQELDD